jgi:hypothetical protein
VELKRIHLENFQSIVGPVTIDIAPLTLLYGGNSVGKSAVADALELLADALWSEADERLIARWFRDGASSMSVGLGYDIDDGELDGFLQSTGMQSLVQPGPQDLELEDDRGYAAAYLLLESIPRASRALEQTKPYRENPPSTAVDIVLRFNKNTELKETTLSIDGHPYVTINGGGRYVDIHRKHPKNCDRNWRATDIFDLIEIHAEHVENEFPSAAAGYFTIQQSDVLRFRYLFEPFLRRGLRDGFSRNARGSRMDVMLTDSADYPPDDEEYEYENDPQVRFLDEHLKYSQVLSLERLRWTLHGCVVLPSRLGGILAKSMLRLGPLREVPKTSDLMWQESIEEREWAAQKRRANIMSDEELDLDSRKTLPDSRWRTGFEAWRYLAFHREERDDVNRMLTGSEGLDLGYQLAFQRMVVRGNPETYTEFDSDNGGGLTKHEVPQQDAAPLGYLSVGLNFRTLHVIDVERNIPLLVTDVGSGISQVVPVLAAIAKNQLISFLEQPELHLHPRAQSKLGDILLRRLTTESQPYRSHYRSVCITETHSEHLALRILRRLRNSIDEMQGRELADSIVFYYFRKVGAETTIHKIRVDSSGRFVDEWPEGFFEDRMEDLFG